MSRRFGSSSGLPPGTEMKYEMSKTSLAENIEMEIRETNPVKWEREGDIGKLEAKRRNHT